MWKKVGNKLNIQNKSNVQLVTQETNRLHPRKSRNQTNSHTNLLIEEKELRQTKINQNLGRTISLHNLGNHQKKTQEKLQNFYCQDSLDMIQEENTQTQANNLNNRPLQMDKLKNNIRSVMKIVHEMKVNQQFMKNDYKEKVLQFKQLMAKLQNTVGQKPYQTVDQALQKIQKYKTKLNDYDQRRDRILKNYGLVWNELL